MLTLIIKICTWCCNVNGHVENSNFNVENTSFLDIENTLVLYVFQTFTSRPNLDVEKRREIRRNVHWV